MSNALIIGGEAQKGLLQIRAGIEDEDWQWLREHHPRQYENLQQAGDDVNETWKKVITDEVPLKNFVDAVDLLVHETRCTAHLIKSWRK